jgi:hypothetical protein
VTVEEFLERLERVKRSGQGWTARCPAHEDKVASLSIGVGDDKRILLKCFAGCSTESIVSALGRELKGLFPDARATPCDPVEPVHQSGAKPHSSRDSTGSDATSALDRLDQEGLRVCTLEAYAKAKGLPIEFLRELHLEDASTRARRRSGSPT